MIWRNPFMPQIMSQRELKAMLNEEECIGVPADEGYQEYLVDYILDENLFENELSNYCVFPIGYNQSIIYIRSDNPLTGGDRRFRYNMIPKCYGLMASEELEETGILRVRRSPQLGYRGSGTLVGIIDTGIRLDDSLFLYEDGSSKVVSLWDQSDQSGTRPEGFLYGTEWTREEINRILQDNIDSVNDIDNKNSDSNTIDSGNNKNNKNSDSNTIDSGNDINNKNDDSDTIDSGNDINNKNSDSDTIDNISSNTKNNIRKLPNDENGHGTFLAAIAAGREDIDRGFSGAAPDAELIVVKLKQSKKYLREFYSIPDEVWSCQEDDVMLAVRYVITMANKLGKPVSICLGIGTNLGGHNGANSLERYISYLSLLPKISFHIAGGNEGISGHHFHGTIRREELYQTVDFNVAEGENGFVMELWGDEPNVYTVGILSPGGENIERMQLKMGEFRSIRFFPENTLLEIRSFPGATIGGSQVIRMNFKNIVPGIWKLFVYGTGNGEKQYDIWLPISNFLKEETVFINPTSEQTVTSPGNAQYALTYAPYAVTTGGLYVRASKGYTRDGRIVPDLSAPGVSVSIPGISRINRVGGVGLSGRERVRSGSSVAAAFGAGIGALMQEWAFVAGYDPFMNGQNMRTYLIQGAVKDGPYEYPNREWGYGKINIYNTLLGQRF